MPVVQFSSAVVCLPVYQLCDYVSLNTVMAFACADKPFQTADKLAAKYVIGIERDGEQFLHSCPFTSLCSLSYVAYAGNIAKNEEEESGSGQHIRMTNSTGHAFDCLLPSPTGDAYLDTADNKVLRCMTCIPCHILCCCRLGVEMGCSA